MHAINYIVRHPNEGARREQLLNQPTTANGRVPGRARQCDEQPSHS